MAQQKPFLKINANRVTQSFTELNVDDTSWESLISGIFTCHFVLAAWALLGSPCGSLLLYSTLLLIVLVWCLKDSQTELPLILAIRINIISIIFDLWVVLHSFDSNYQGIFVLIGRIMNLFLRFVTIPLLSKICSDRTGGLNDGLPDSLSPIFGVDHANAARDPYENIDNVPHQSYPKTEPVIGPSGSYSFAGNVPPYQAQA